MTLKRTARQLILSAAGPAVALLVIGVFAGYALLGTNGLLARGEYRKQLDQKQSELAVVEAERARLENRKRLLAKGDPDLADELTRSATDMVGEDEYVIVTR